VQLRERQNKIEEACLQLEQEHAELEREIEHRKDGRRARTTARNVNRRILVDDEGALLFARASQNIATATALLEGLLEPTTPKGCHPTTS
jgi:hypothetical protein